MPKEKKLTQCIPKIYKRNAENIGMFFWVRAQKDLVPTITVVQSIRKFFIFTGISIDEWDISCAEVTYYRLQEEFFEDCKS